MQIPEKAYDDARWELEDRFLGEDASWGDIARVAVEAAAPALIAAARRDYAKDHDQESLQAFFRSPNLDLQSHIEELCDAAEQLRMKLVTNLEF